MKYLKIKIGCNITGHPSKTFFVSSLIYLVLLEHYFRGRQAYFFFLLFAFLLIFRNVRKMHNA
jgi:hypothetical protein